MSWQRYQAKALAGMTLAGDALLAEIEGYIRVHNPQLTDVRVEKVTATEGYDTRIRTSKRWYDVTYLADDGEGHTTTP